MILEKLTAQPLQKEEIELIIGRAKSFILNNSPMAPQKIIVFGSAARFEMTVFSDLDIIVVVKEKKDVREYCKLLGKLSVELGIPVDLLIVDSETYKNKSEIGGVYFVAREEGIIIYTSES